jgi:hypothetical protein
MPNWCNNVVEISHKDQSKMESLVAAINEGKFCNHVIPVPESLHIVAGRVGEATDPTQIELEAQEKANLETHGYATWYDFCVNEWGTKWDVDPYNPIEFDSEWDKNNKITFGFDSAWAPPLGVYETLVEQGFAVRGYYFEGGMNFAGIWEDGIDDFYEIPGNSVDAAEELPSVLDEMFCISESMAEYEAENAEEDEVQEWYEDGVNKLGLEPHNNANK